MNRKSGCNANQRKSAGSVNKPSAFTARSGFSSVRKSSIPIRRSTSVENIPSSSGLSKFNSRISQCGTARKRSSSFSGRNSCESVGRFTLAPDQRFTTKDPRPFSDKNYLNQSLQRLVNYLQGKGFTISYKNLQAPTAKEFARVFEYFFRKLDPKFVVKKLEEDVPACLKLMGYPFPVGKATLQSVGSRHTLPTLIGILTWLLDTVLYLENLNILQYSFQGDEFDSSENHFLLLYQRCLEACSVPEDSQLENNDDEFLESLAKSTFGNVEQLQLLAEEKETLSNRIQAHSQEIRQHKFELHNTQCIKGDVERLRDYTRDLKKRMEQKQAELLGHKNELQKLKEEEAVLEKEANKLGKMYENQHFGPGNLKLMTVHKQQNKEKVEMEKLTCENLGKERWELEIAYLNMCSKVDADCERFNAQYQELCCGKGHNSLPVSIQRELEGFRASLPEFQVASKLDPTQYSKWCNEILPALSKYEKNLEDLEARTKRYILTEKQLKRNLIEETECIKNEMKPLEVEISQAVEAAEKNKKQILTEYAEKQMVFSKLKQEITKLEQRLILQPQDYKSTIEGLEKELNNLKITVEEREMQLQDLRNHCAERVAKFTNKKKEFEGQLTRRMKRLLDELRKASK